jgi:hypothetical protein
MSSGMTFARDDLAIEPSRVGTTVARLAGKTGPLPAGTVRGGALLIPWTPAAPGVATIGISLAPKNLDLAANLIEVYFLDINADAQTRAQWAAIPAPHRLELGEARRARSRDRPRVGPDSPACRRLAPRAGALARRAAPQLPARRVPRRRGQARVRADRARRPRHGAVPA